jgi:hypothetical protein
MRLGLQNLIASPTFTRGSTRSATTLEKENAEIVGDRSNSGFHAAVSGVRLRSPPSAIEHAEIQYVYRRAAGSMAGALAGTECATVEQEPRRRRGLYRSGEAAIASCGCWEVSVHVSEKAAVCASDPDVAVTVTVDVTGWDEVTTEEDPPQPLSNPIPATLPVAKTTPIPSHVLPRSKTRFRRCQCSIYNCSIRQSISLVSGHDFSRAANAAIMTVGFTGCGKRPEFEWNSRKASRRG